MRYEVNAVMLERHTRPELVHTSQYFLVCPATRGSDHSDKAELTLIIKSAAGAEKEVWELVPHEHHHGHCVVLNCHV